MNPEDMTGKEPIELGERRSDAVKKESVLPEDIDKIMKLNKDALRVYALKKLGINLDLSQHIAIIRGDIVKRAQVALGIILQDSSTDESTRKEIEKIIPMYVKNNKTNRVFDSSPELLKRQDLIPCTKEGIPLKANEYYIPVSRPRFKGNSRNELERMYAGMEQQIRNDL
jgi:hypothetical protein